MNQAPDAPSENIEIPANWIKCHITIPGATIAPTLAGIYESFTGLQIHIENTVITVSEGKKPRGRKPFATNFLLGLIAGLKENYSGIDIQIEFEVDTTQPSGPAELVQVTEDDKHLSSAYGHFFNNNIPHVIAFHQGYGVLRGSDGQPHKKVDMPEEDARAALERIRKFCEDSMQKEIDAHPNMSSGMKTFIESVMITVKKDWSNPAIVEELNDQVQNPYSFARGF